MSSRRGSLHRAPLLALALAVALAGPGFSCGSAAPESSSPTATIRGQAVVLEVARTPEEQTLGLGNRNALPWGHGMLFVYDQPAFLSFWMKRMRFDIDIVWIREGRIVGISPFVPHPREHPERPATVRSPELADAVLEVPAGYAEAQGWRRGDAVVLAGVDDPS